MTARAKKLEDPSISRERAGFVRCAPSVLGERWHKLPWQFINWPVLSFRFYKPPHGINRRLGDGFASDSVIRQPVLSNRYSARLVTAPDLPTTPQGTGRQGREPMDRRRL